VGWQTIFDFDTEAITDLAETAVDTLDSVVSILDALATFLDTIASLYPDVDDPIIAIINALLEILEGICTDLLTNSVSAAIHTNINWDPGWTWAPARKLTDVDVGDGQTTWNNNYTTDGDLPWKGTGLFGWFRDILASCNNPNDIYAPISDTETASTGMFVMCYGVPGFSAFEDIVPMFKKVFSIDDFQEQTGYWKSGWEEWGDSNSRKPFRRLGTAFSSKLITDAAAGQSETDTVWEEMSASIKEKLSPVNPFLDDDGAALNFDGLMGEMPIWFGTPIAKLFGPPMQSFFEALQDLINNLKFPGEGLFQRMVDVLVAKIQEFNEILEKISDLIEDLAALIDLITQLHFYVGQGSGGIPGVISDAMSDEDAPDFGSDGLVVGMVAIYNVDLGGEHIKTLMNLFSGDASAMFDDVLPSTDQISDAWSGVTDANDDASWNS
jgi:hypothetical protein